MASARAASTARATLVAASALFLGCLAGARHPRGAKGVGPAASASRATGGSGVSGAPGVTGSTAMDVSSAASTVELVADADPSAASDTSPDATPSPSGSASGTFASGTGPATIYGALDGGTCEAQLKKRGVPFVRVPGGARGVERPIRLTGKLHGVDFHSMVAPKDRATSLYEILDCRLALALDDLATLLATHDVVEVVHFSMYRPPGKNADLSKPKSQHEGAMAIDLATMVKKDGSKLSVLGDWHGGIGQKTCGPGAGPTPSSKVALEIRGILCDVAQKRYFNVILTPNFNKPHQNHFHLEITKGVKWFLVH